MHYTFCPEHMKLHIPNEWRIGESPCGAYDNYNQYRIDLKWWNNPSKFFRPLTKLDRDGLVNPGKVWECIARGVRAE